jgi:hypothetical protein
VTVPENRLDAATRRKKILLRGGKPKTMGPSVVVVECDAQRCWLIEMFWVAGVVEEERCVGRLGS